MLQGKKFLGLIPARGGSKGIKRKNIREIAGSPLISYTIRAGLASKALDAVVVSTDDEEIASVARSYGAEIPFMRPAELAGDTSKTVDCVVHAVRTLASEGREYDAVVLLQPTSPLRRASEIDDACELFLETEMRGVASVSEVHDHPILIRSIGEGHELHKLLEGTGSTARRQDMPAFYRVDGGIYVNATSTLGLDTSFNDNPIGYVVEDADSAVDIDTMEDFRRAERLLEGRHDGER